MFSSRHRFAVPLGVDFLRRRGSKDGKNKGQKLYIEEPNAENPYYYPVLGIDKKYSGKTRASEGSVFTPQHPSSSTKARDARRADKAVAEEARARANASKQEPVKGKGKASSKTSGAKGITKSAAKRRIESDDEGSEDEGSKLVSRPPGSDEPLSTISPNESKRQSNRKPARGNVPAEDKLEKAGLSAQERVRQKTHPRREPTPMTEEEEVAELEHKNKKNKVQQVKDNEAEAELVSERGQKRVVSYIKGDDDEEVVGVEEEQRRGKRARINSNGGDPSSISSQPSTDGLRIVKTSKMTVKLPTLGSVATRTRQRTKQ